MAAVGTMAYPAHASIRTYQPQQLGAYPAATQEPRTYASSPASVNSYPNHSVPPRQHAHYRSTSASWGNDRPAGEAVKPSLPPISNLLGIADGERARVIRNENSPPHHRPFNDRIPVHPSGSPYASSHALDRKPSPPRSSWIDSVAPATKHVLEQAHGTIPNPLQFRHSSAGDRARSPSTRSTGSASSLTPRLAAAHVGGAEPYEAIPGKPAAVQAAASPVSNPHPASSPYTPASNGPIRYPTSYPSPDSKPAPPEDAYQQRPLPSNFPPHVVAPSPTQQAQSTQQQQQQQQQQPPQPPQPEPAHPTANPWQHHHYIGTTSQATYPTPQDRYVCNTCSKAFSRPSSLKIHSHSHTGEKPFRCPQVGCGKAFSVRSNMKRHERGCHPGMDFPSGEDASMTDAPALM